MRFITIGRHEYTPLQRKLLEKTGLTEEVKRVVQVDDVREVVGEAEKLGAVIVIQALPMHVLAQLLQAASRAGIPVYSFRIEAITTVGINETCPKECDIEISDPRSGNKRCSRTAALQRLKRIVVDTEDVATV